MRSYWFWILMLGTAWTLGLIQLSMDVSEMPFRIFGSAIFFGLFFLMPLLKKMPLLALLNLMGMAALAIWIFWPAPGSPLNLYPLLIFSIIAGKAVYRLSVKGAIIIGIILLAGALLHSLAGDSGISVIFILLYALLLGAALLFFRISYIF